MDDFSLYQWLVLGLLSIIALCAGIITLMLGFGLDSNMEMRTRRLESALGRVRDEVEHLRIEINSATALADDSADFLDDDTRARLEHARERTKLRGKEP